MSAISMDLRVRVFEAREAGETTAEVAERFAVSSAFVRRLMQRHREAGTLAPKGGRRGPAPRLAADAGR
ncbi:MAG: helix-turn-helix domain-containing protein, partial [Gemmataceae bacterium]|nr:helix-turn-helix domain-containing protein [Gemmataceae bacterium]